MKTIKEAVSSMFLDVVEDLAPEQFKPRKFASNKQIKEIESESAHADHVDDCDGFDA